MNQSTYQLIFQGEIAPGRDPLEVKKKIGARFHIDDARLDRLFNGSPILIKERVDYKTALKYQILFEWAGAVCHIETVTGDAEDEALKNQRTHVDVIFDGAIAQRYQQEDVKKNLKALLKLSDRRIAELFSGHPVIIMHDVDYHPALKIQTSFELAGALCRLEPVESLSSDEIVAEAPQQESGQDVSYAAMSCPKCGREQKKARKCRYCGIYIETYLKKNAVSTVGSSKKSSNFQKRPEFKKELLHWGIGLILLGCIQMAGLGIWASAIVVVGILNLLIQSRVMFLLNGITLLISGASGLIFLILQAVFKHQESIVQAGNGESELILDIGYIVIMTGIQFYMGAQAFKKFTAYRHA